MRLERVSDSVYADVEGASGGNVGIIVGGDGALAVDSQYPGSAALFRQQIKGVTEKPVKRLLLTHIHGDHVFGAQAFEGCEIVSHRRLREKAQENLKAEWSPAGIRRIIENVARSTPARSWLFEGLRVVLPATVFESSTRLGGVEVTHMGGHTDCSSVAYLPEERVLFAGDLLFVGRFPYAGDATADPDSWIGALRRILGWKVDHIVPGHGPLCSLDEVRKQLNWFEAVREEMTSLIDGGAPEEEVVTHRYPELYPAASPESKFGGFRRWYRVWSSGRGSVFQPS